MPMALSIVVVTSIAAAIWALVHASPMWQALMELHAEHTCRFECIYNNLSAFQAIAPAQSPNH